ncbi:MAG: polysaccharide deacetylase family protein [Chlorobi bacterium]|nr:polysaccharide deacetylase family protein [Chlorobiota bacterium]
MARWPVDGTFAVTIDDGPCPGTTEAVLDALGRVGINACFFLTGNAARRNSRLVRLIAEKGHAIGSHGMTHRRLPLLAGRETAGEIRDSIALLQDITGKPVRFFRPPYGWFTRSMLEELPETTSLMLWSNMPGDFMKSMRPELLITRLQFTLRSGDILVLHEQPGRVDMTSRALAALPEIAREKDLSVASFIEERGGAL